MSERRYLLLWSFFIICLQEDEVFSNQHEHAGRFAARASAAEEADDEHDGADGEQHVQGQVVVLVLLHHRDVDARVQDQPCGQRQNRQTSQLHT